MLRFASKRAATFAAAAGSGPAPVGEDPEPPTRRNTDMIYQTINVNGRSFHPTSVNAYNLKWEKLRLWLDTRFKGYEGVHFVQKQV